MMDLAYPKEIGKTGFPPVHDVGGATGVGLSIVREIAEGHDPKPQIRVGSTGGARFAGPNSTKGAALYFSRRHT